MLQCIGIAGLAAAPALRGGRRANGESVLVQAGGGSGWHKWYPFVGGGGTGAP